MKHMVTREEATLVRHLASGGSDGAHPSGDHFRIWAPPTDAPELRSGEIAVVAASGRAGCRECGETIAAGEDAIAFGFDPSGDRWALVRAYIHAAPCRVYRPEED